MLAPELLSRQTFDLYKNMLFILLDFHYGLPMLSSCVTPLLFVECTHAPVAGEMFASERWRWRERERGKKNVDGDR